MQVLVASGAVLRCQHKIQQLQWHLQGCAFHIDVTLLPQPCYDMILGMDWLRSFSPMRVHWAHKWLSIPYQGRTVTLHGQSVVIPECTIVNSYWSLLQVQHNQNCILKFSCCYNSMFQFLQIQWAFHLHGTTTMLFH